MNFADWPSLRFKRDEAGEEVESEQSRRAARLEAEAEAEDERALAEELRAAARAAEQRNSKVRSDRESRDSQRRKDSASEAARQKRLSSAPPATAIPIPQPGDESRRNGESTSRDVPKSQSFAIFTPLYSTH